MGNNIFWCYAESKDVQENPRYENKNSKSQQGYEDVSLQFQDEKKQLFLKETNQTQIQSNNLQNECQFCISYLKTSDIKLKKKFNNYNNINHPIHQEDFQKLHFQLEPLVLLYNDPISKIVSTWFQLAIALPKYVQNNIKSDEIEQKIGNFEDLQTLICLKWGVVDFFKLPQLITPKDKIIRECFEIFKRIVHYCIFFNEVFLENYSNTEYKANILLYIKCYQYYQKLMYGYAHQYEQQIDKMQQIYQQQFSFKNENNQYPNFKVIGYMMRFWCQIMLTTKIQMILEESFQHLDQLKDQTIFYQYVIYALDVNINEDNVHWIGHRENFKYDKKLLSHQHWEQIENEINLEDENYYNQISNMLAQQKMLYPSWYYESEIEYKVIRNNIKRIWRELQYKSQHSSSIFVDSQEFEDKLQSEEFSRNSENDFSEQKESHQSLKNYLKQLLITNVIPESCDALDSIETLDKIRRRLSASSNMSTEVNITVNLSKRVDNIEKLISDLILIKRKLKQREFILSQRASKWKLQPKRSIEWLHYFERTSFDKIPDSHNELYQYIQGILQKLYQTDDYYQKQLYNF